ncbi:MAG: FAD:protein FMN transferase [Candidatus Firestonebacteria bacterium]
MAKTFKCITITILFLVLPILVSAGDDGLVKKTRYLMDTYCSIYTPKSEDADKAMDKALDSVEALNNKFSAFLSGSQVYEFNTKGTPITDPEIMKVIKIALDVTAKSGGAFDITVKPLITLWGFYGELPKDPKVPGKDALSAALKLIGPGTVAVQDGKLVKLRKTAQIDLGAVAKGYAVDRAMRSLKESGIKSALVDLGGDIYALGTYKGKPWKAGIKNPRGEGALGVMDLTELSISTSGDYERYFVKDGRRYCHIIDPRTGYPATELMCAAIIAPDATLADALSTAVFVLGREKGLELLKAYPQTEAIIIDAQGGVSLSEGLKKIFSKTKKGGKDEE